MTAIPSPAFWAAFLPVARANILPGALSRLPLILPAAFTPIPNLIDSIWEGILKAVPKKKTSYARKRARQMAPQNRLKDITFFVNCSSCGRPKRAHVLCQYCVASMKNWFYTKLGVGEAMREEAKKVPDLLKPDLHLIGKRRLANYSTEMANVEKEHKRWERRTALKEARKARAAEKGVSKEQTQKSGSTPSQLEAQSQLTQEPLL